MKLYQKILATIFVFGSLANLSSCDKDDDDPQQQAAVPLELECNTLVADGETLTLEDRGTGVDYIINCKATVDGDLIINPGVTIQFGSTGAINVTSGSFNAIGTPNSPITFTGEDKVPGSWGYIVIKSDDVNNLMAYCQVEYAGGFQVSSNGDKGNVILMHNSRLGIDNCTISNGEESGVKITSSSSELTSFSNNTMTSCKYPIQIPANLVHIIDGGSFVGNLNDAIHVTTDGGGNSPTVSDGNTHTWKKQDVPYKIGKDLIVTGGTLEILPGITLEFDNGVGIEVGDSDASTLIADGTAAAPILFTGVNKVAGAWNSIEFEFTQSPLNSISHATIEYAGSENGAIVLWSDPVLSVDNVAFKNNSSCAFYDNVPDFNPSAQVVNPNLSWSNLTFDNITNENGETDQTNFPGGPFSYCH